MIMSSLSASHRQRLITGGLLFLVAAACLALGGWFLFGLVLLVALAAAWEFMDLLEASLLCHIAALSFIAVGLTSVQLGHPEIAVALPVLVFWMGSLRFLVQHTEDISYPYRHLPFFSLFYIGVPFGLALTFPLELQILVLAGVIASDVGAFYTGSQLGGPKLWPSISPKKTWAGGAGGGLSAMLIVFGLGSLIDAPLLPKLVDAPVTAGGWLALGVVISIAAQLGDFFQSALKRKAGKKDSSNLLPGHGGVLDRIDGLLAAIVAAALFFYLWPTL